MKSSMKRLVSLMLVLIMLLGMLPTAYAAEPPDAAAPDTYTEIGTEPTEANEASVEATEPSEVPEVTSPTEGTEATVPSEETEVTESSEGVEPTEPSQVTEATEPAEETTPTEPTEVTEVTEPSEATEAIAPSEETAPTEPTEAEDPTEPAEETEPALPVADLSADVESATTGEASAADIALTGDAAADLEQYAPVTDPVTGTDFTLAEPDPYGIALMAAADDTELDGTHYEKANVWLEGTKLQWTYNGVTITQNHYNVHGIWPTGGSGSYTAYCIDPATGAGDEYSSTATTSWNGLDRATQRAVGLALLYGAPNGLYSSDHKTNLAYEIATQIIVHELVLGWRNNTAPYTRTNSHMFDNIYNSKRLQIRAASYSEYSDLDWKELDKDVLKNAYNTIAANMASHGSVPSFAARSQNLASTKTYTMTRQSNGTYSVTLTDTNNVLSKCSFVNGNGLTYTISGNKLTITAQSYFSGTKSCAWNNSTGFRKNVPDLEKQTFLLWTAPNKQTMVCIGEAKNDPIPLYFNVKAEDARSNLKIKKVALNTDGTVDADGDVEDYAFQLKQGSNDWRFVTDKNGNGIECDTSYNVTGDALLENIGPGTYYIAEILSHKGSGSVYPAAITVDIVNNNGASVSGDSWPKTYYPKGGNGSFPTVANQSTNYITFYQSVHGNAHLSGITFSSSDLGPGKTVVISVRNKPIPSNLKIRKESDTGDVSNYEFYIKKSGGEEWRAKTNANGDAMQAEASANNGAYTVIKTSDTTLEGFTAGTYDIMERLVTKGKDRVYPAEITIDIVDSSNKSVSGDGWPRTYYPGGVQGTLPQTAAAGSGTAGTITIDSGTGNARLNRITFKAGDLGDGKTITVTVKNQEYPAGLSIRKSSGTDELSVANACFKLYRWGTNYRSHKTWYVKTNADGVGYKATYEDGTYTITSNQVTDLTNGTYDFVEDLEAMGLAGIVFPTSWTVRVLDRNNEVISEETYYPGTTEGASITKDDNGNARLRQIEIADMENGAKIVMEIHNRVGDGKGRLIKTVTDGSAADTCFKLFRWGAGNGILTSKTWYVKTDDNGNGYEATYNNGTYTITKELPNITNGKYDIIEDLVAMQKAGVFFPDSWTITVRDKDGNEVNSTTYYPGNTAGTSITKDDNGNPRLGGIEITGLTDGGWVEMKINNAPWPAQAYVKKIEDGGNVAGACFALYNWDNKLHQYVITDKTGEGYAATVTTDENGKKVYTKTEVKGFDGLTDGTYDFVEDLVAMGVDGRMFPESWTVTVRDKDGKVVNTKTYYPGDVKGQNITIDSDGNARLEKIKIEGITDGGWVEMEIKNTLFKGEVHLKKTSIGCSAANACFKLYRWGGGVLPHYTWYVKTDENGNGYEATTNADGTLTITDKLPNITNGTYDILEDLVSMGVAGTVFPTSWTVTVRDADGNVVNSTTYTRDDPNGNIITVDDDNNARLKQIKIEGLEDGGWVEMEITNESIVGKISAEKVDVYGNHLAGVKFCLEWSADGTAWAPVTAAVDGKVAPGSCSSEGLDENGCLITGEDGFVTFDGLDTTMYYRLTEVETVNGFSLLPDAVFEGKLPTEEDFVLSFKVIDDTITLNTGSTELYATVTIGMALMLLGLCAAMTAILPDKRRNIRR